MVIKKTDDQWRELLSEEQYRVLRQKGTEVPFSGEFVTPRKDGDYYCVACGAHLFSAKDQYESRTPGLIGWPGFEEAVSDDAVVLKPDTTHGMVRTEVTCANCGGHLGHLFDDASSPNGKHYCVNSVCLTMKPEQNAK